MTSRPPILRHTAGANLTLFGATSLLDNFFASSSFQVASSATPEVIIESVAQHTRRRYPGDNGHIVQSHARVTTDEVSEAGGGAKPGDSFWCERTEGGEGSPSTVVARQFAYTGTWKDLKAFARANVTGGNFRLRNHSGRSIIVED